MTYEEAVEAMRNGKRVRNSNFTPEEYFEMKEGRVYGEDGVNMAGWYRGYDWQKEGWSVV